LALFGLTRRVVDGVGVGGLIEPCVRLLGSVALRSSSIERASM